MNHPQRTEALFDFVTAAVFTFLLGVLIHAAFPFDSTPTSFIVALGIGIVVSMLLPHRFRWMAAAGCFGLALGMLRFDLTLPSPGMAPDTTVIGTVTDAGRYDVRMRDERTGAIVSISIRRGVGERIRVTCGRMDPLPRDSKALFDARRGAWFRCRGSVSVASVGAASGWDPRRMLAAWRSLLTRRIQRMLPGDAGSLLAGILYGERGLSAEAAAAFKTAGMTHLIAVSGSNIAIVVALFVPFFLLLGYRRKPAIVLSGIAITLFVLFVGAQASVVRAALMGWLALLARVCGRRASAARLLLIAAAVIVLFDPWALAFDAGFALSFLATGGLLAWSRPFAKRLGWIPGIFGLREAAATTLAATIATFPYSLWAFGSASLAGLLTNLFAVPLVGVAMLWGAVALAIGPRFSILALPVQGFLEAMLAIARVSQVAPFLRVAWTVPTWALFACYAFLLLPSLPVRRRSYPQVDPQRSDSPSDFEGLVRRV